MAVQRYSASLHQQRADYAVVYIRLNKPPSPSKKPETKLNNEQGVSSAMHYLGPTPRGCTRETSDPKWRATRAYSANSRPMDSCKSHPKWSGFIFRLHPCVTHVNKIPLLQKAAIQRPPSCKLFEVNKFWLQRTISDVRVYVPHRSATSSSSVSASTSTSTIASTWQCCKRSWGATIIKWAHQR